MKEGECEKPKQPLLIFCPKNNPEGFSLRQFLGQHLIPFEWKEINTNEECQKCLNLPDIENVRFPVIEIEGQKLFGANAKEVAEKLGWIHKPRLKEYDLAIYGGGPAGLSAAVHAAFDGLTTILIERKSIGGQAASSALIENFLGFPKGISGAELAQKALEQAIKFGVEICLMSEGVAAEFENDRVVGVLSDGTKVAARANLCACGVEYRRLGIKDEEKFLNAGISYGAGATESPFCRDEEVFIVGGGNAAGQAALNFSRYAKKVRMVVRADNLSETLSKNLIDRVTKNPKIEILYHTQVKTLEGDTSLRKIELINMKDQKIQEYNASKLFVCIGGKPQTDYFKNTQVVRDRAGYIVTGLDLGKLENWKLNRQPYYLESSVPGLFAAGDVRHHSIKRYATAVGEGAMAVGFIERYLNEKGEM